MSVVLSGGTPRTTSRCRVPRGCASTSSRKRDASDAKLLDVLGAAASTLAPARAAPSGARGIYSTGMADAGGFLAMGCDEILVHT